MSIIRQNIPLDLKNPVDHLDSGYEGATSDSFTIPSCGIEDVDKSVKGLFANDIGYQIRSVASNTKGSIINVKKPQVTFAAGERFAKKSTPTKNKDGSLILPSIAVRRTGIQQTMEDSISRGMNQTTGKMVIKKRLDSSDRDYQQFLNKVGLTNSDLPNSRHTTGSFGPQADIGTSQGGLLNPHFGNNIWEIFTIPQPQFWTINYEITMWTNYVEHMNYLLETTVNSFLPQGKMFKLTTDKGYWFIGYVDDDFNNVENFDDFTEKDRLIRYTFTMQVKAYLLASKGPGARVPVRRHVSSPTISFDIQQVDGQVFEETQVAQSIKDSEFVINEIATSDDQLPTTNQKMLVDRTITGPNKQKSVKTTRMIEQNQKSGETVYYAPAGMSLSDFVSSIK